MENKWLNKAEWRLLFLAIRWSYLTNQELMGASDNKIFEEGKDFITQALSVRLNPKKAFEEKALDTNIRINLTPRILY